MINQITKCSPAKVETVVSSIKKSFIPMQEPDTFVRSGSDTAEKSKSFFSRLTQKVKDFYRTHISPPPQILKEVADIEKGPVLDSESYLKISDETKVFLRKKIGKNITSAVDDTVSCSVALKKYYERIYGEDNFQIVSIGHSPELIAKTLEHMGIKVKYMPLSDVGHCPYYETLEKSVTSSPNFLKFIKELGLTGEQIAQNPKQIIFLDYTNHGKTLNYVKQLFQTHFKVPKEKVDFRSLNKDLKFCASECEEGEIKLPQNIKFNTEHADKYIENYLKKTKVEDFSNIPYLGYNNLNSVYERINNYKNPYGKLFNFKLIDTIEQMGATTLKVDSTLKTQPLETKTYDKLITKANKILKGEHRPTITEATSQIVPRALSLKSLYDKIYGKGQYKLVSIGTSPSLMATAMETAGVETKYMPISNLIFGGYEELSTAVKNSPNYMKFLKELGLTKEAIETGDKKVVFIDYTASGATLRKIKYLFEDVFNISKDKIEFRSVNSDLYEALDKNLITSKTPETQDTIHQYIQDYLQNNKFAKYRIVPSLPYEKVDSVYKVLQAEQEPIAKLLKFDIQKTVSEMKPQ